LAMRGSVIRLCEISELAPAYGPDSVNTLAS
jgi:hypothetical protein